MSIDSRKLVKKAGQIKTGNACLEYFLLFRTIFSDSGDTVSDDLIGIDGDLATRLSRLHNHFYIRSITQ